MGMRDERPSALSFETVHVILPILVGGTIYILYREPSLLVFRWLDTLHLDRAVDLLRASTIPTFDMVPHWALVNLPDGLWVYAVASQMAWVWRDASPTRQLCWFSLGPVLGVGSEIGQCIGLVQGMFDQADLVACGFATLIAGVHLIRFRSPSSSELYSWISTLNGRRQRDARQA